MFNYYNVVRTYILISCANLFNLILISRKVQVDGPEANHLCHDTNVNMIARVAGNEIWKPNGKPNYCKHHSRANNNYKTGVLSLKRNYGPTNHFKPTRILSSCPSLL